MRPSSPSTLVLSLFLFSSLLLSFTQAIQRDSDADLDLFPSPDRHHHEHEHEHEHDITGAGAPHLHIPSLHSLHDDLHSSHHHHHTTAPRAMEHTHGHAHHDAPHQEHLTIMSWNIWESLRLFPNGLALAKQVIDSVKPDILAVQEARADTVAEIAKVLGPPYKAYPESHVVSRFHAIKEYPFYPHGARAAGVTLEVKPNVFVRVFTVHLSAYPYAPYDLRAKPEHVVDLGYNIHYGSPPAVVLANAKKSQGRDIVELLAKWVDNPHEQRHLPTFVMGDFNIPSHLDHTEEVCKDAGYNKARNWPCVPMEWPATFELEKNGFVDTFREVHPNVTTDAKSYGFTWTPRLGGFDHVPADQEVHDRLDFIFYRESALHKMKTVESYIVDGIPDANSFPSDHRAMVSKVLLTTEH